MSQKWYSRNEIGPGERNLYRYLMECLAKAISKKNEEWDYVANECTCEASEEIRSGAITEVYFPGAYIVNANTAKGLPKFLAREIPAGDSQSEVRTLRQNLEWSTYGASIRVVRVPSLPNPESVFEDRPVELGEEPQVTSADLLSRLADRSLSRNLLRKAILEAEVGSFDADQANFLKPLLRRYIEENRDSADPTNLVAVASAIRKYVGILGQEEISSVGFVLEAGHRAPVQPELELEVTKMLVRKLSAVLPRESNSFPELGSQLMDLARTYLNPRLLPRQHHGAIALNSVLAVTLLRTHGLEELIDILGRLPLPWFKQLVIRRAKMLEQDLAHRFPGSEFNPHRENLEALIPRPNKFFEKAGLHASMSIESPADPHPPFRRDWTRFGRSCAFCPPLGALERTERSSART